jgi:hypothetical protein
MDRDYSPKGQDKQKEKAGNSAGETRDCVQCVSANAWEAALTPGKYGKYSSVLLLN